MKNKKGAYFGLIILAVLSIYGLYKGGKKEQSLKETGKYTIGVIEKLKIGSKGIIVFITYYFENRKIETNYMTDYENKVKLYPGKRVFIKFMPNIDEKYFDLDLDCIVPDSIKNAPSNGWSEQWMKDNFPDYMKLINN